MGIGKGKGSSFEREMAKKLSLWWTDGEHDDIFWRTAGSGARATRRSQLNQMSVAGHGDLMAYHSIGEPFTDLTCIEVKRGYNFNLIDIFTKKHGGDISYFWNQAVEAASGAGDKFPLLIWKPDRLPTFIVFQDCFVKQLALYSPLDTTSSIRFTILDIHNLHLQILDTFLMNCSPDGLRALHESRFSR